MRSTGKAYRLLLPDGSVETAGLRGLFRNKGLELNATNPIAVGDWVQAVREGPAWTIADIEDRRNYLLRHSAHRRHEVQILAANLDQVVVVFTLKLPYTAIGYLDRLLVCCEAWHIPAVVLFNKTDLLEREKDDAKLHDLMELYSGLGYPCLALSAIDPASRPQLHNLLANRTSMLVGKSGAGKSSLLNLLQPGLGLRTGNLAVHSNKGMHTTTFAEMFALDAGGFVIDAPGVKEFELVDITADELGQYYPEFRQRMASCRFANCQHLNEPGCAVLQALQEGQVAASRYNAYVGIRQSLIEAD